jgi:DNA processing protein
MYLSQIDKELEVLKSRRINVFLKHCGNYPFRLKQTHNAPPIIYAMGEGLLDGPPAVGIVGSRRSSFYGEKMARRLAEELAEIGVVTISGLARGIDTCVHSASLKAGGQTWAVIGSGLEEVYPPENRKLANDISQCGVVLSEFPIFMKPHPSNFPRRNRIISGLSLGVVVVEGSDKSGALITARLAAEEGRDVFAVPGPVTSTLSAAPHRLLRLGAKMVESAADIVEEFGEAEKEKLSQSKTSFSNEKVIGMAGSHNDVLRISNGQPVSKELLAEKLEMSSAAVNALLLEMELKGLIKSLAGGMVVKL